MAFYLVDPARPILHFVWLLQKPQPSRLPDRRISQQGWLAAACITASRRLSWLTLRQGSHCLGRSFPLYRYSGHLWAWLLVCAKIARHGFNVCAGWVAPRTPADRRYGLSFDNGLTLFPEGHALLCFRLFPVDPIPNCPAISRSASSPSGSSGLGWAHIEGSKRLLHQWIKSSNNLCPHP